ncbi:hypothetical protein ZIOFF_003370 [Zingiber officinale]|uniref:C2 domain-containing protein n=1 Tax=Zingiber officinale TaxID=94328 RepID=A0A8J5I0T1_ZINOF|nr:hypothetical protein ZIOFF_003370 [Zingiber officinale]
MGGCFSDVKGGQQAIGAAGPTASVGSARQEVDDAVGYLFHSRGLRGLCTSLESDPLAVLYLKRRDGMLEELGRTEVIMNNLSPSWITKFTINYQFEIVQHLVIRVYDVDTKYFNIPVKTINLNEQDYLGEASFAMSEENPLIIECFDFNDSGKHDQLGLLQTSVADLEKLARENCGANLYVQSRSGAKKILKGQLHVDNFIEKTQYSFLDYISNGFELNFMVAIDFTASNGDPRLPASLHFIDPSGRLNSYQQAIVGVGEVLQFYDSDKHFPAWGFGGRVSYGSVSHCFNLKGSPEESEVSGVEGIMAAYAMALHNVTLAGPTLFGPVIHRAAEIAGQSLLTSRNKYYVLLIITDGVITDLQETINAIVKASDLPLSILIVGVGGADYKEMNILDADDGKRLESSTGRIATRDIVQFVPMRDLQGNQVSVAQSLLEELPGQFLSYMRSRDIKPNFAYTAEAPVSMLS